MYSCQTSFKKFKIGVNLEEAKSMCSIPNLMQLEKGKGHIFFVCLQKIDVFSIIMCIILV